MFVARRLGTLDKRLAYILENFIRNALYRGRSIIKFNYS